MFEKRILKISEDFAGEEKNLFYILTHQKHKREIYFRNTEEAVEFIKDKLSSTTKKRLAYFLIRFGFLQFWLKTVYLSEKMGDVIFVAHQIKCFDLNRRRVLSFSLMANLFLPNPPFLKLKETHLKVAKKGLAPKVFEFNKDYPYFEEELLDSYKGHHSLPLEILKKYHKKTGLIHGDLIPEHILADPFWRFSSIKESHPCVFIDWNLRKGSHETDVNNLIESKGGKQKCQ